MPAYDPNNVLAKILRGEIPSIKVYEDSDTLVIMDIMPQAEGHVLVIPRAPSRNLLDADPATFKPLYETVQIIARAVQLASARRAFLYSSSTRRRPDSRSIISMSMSCHAMRVSPCAPIPARWPIRHCSPNMPK